MTAPSIQLLFKSYGGKTKFVSINFQHLATSARINPIAPRYIQDRKKLSHLIMLLSGAWALKTVQRPIDGYTKERILA